MEAIFKARSGGSSSARRVDASYLICPTTVSIWGHTPHTVRTVSIWGRSIWGHTHLTPFRLAADLLPIQGTPQSDLDLSRFGDTHLIPIWDSIWGHTPHSDLGTHTSQLRRSATAWFEELSTFVAALAFLSQWGHVSICGHRDMSRFGHTPHSCGAAGLGGCGRRGGCGRSAMEAGRMVDFGHRAV